MKKYNLNIVGLFIILNLGAYIVQAIPYYSKDINKRFVCDIDPDNISFIPPKHMSKNDKAKLAKRLVAFVLTSYELNPNKGNLGDDFSEFVTSFGSVKYSAAENVISTHIFWSEDGSLKGLSGVGRLQHNHNEETFNFSIKYGVDGQSRKIIPPTWYISGILLDPFTNELILINGKNNDCYPEVMTQDEPEKPNLPKNINGSEKQVTKEVK
ncbi:MAG: hypothetical protein K0R14_1043 [Burkholderiales bacterium]|jgi:hypothetical protein|nr:hypothetical protein [Burkholderiales bacterium]